MKDLKELRKEIDVVDAGLLELLKQRFDITEQIGEYKAKNNQELFCPEREEEKKQSLRAVFHQVSLFLRGYFRIH